MITQMAGTCKVTGMTYNTPYRNTVRDDLTCLLGNPHNRNLYKPVIILM